MRPRESYFLHDHERSTDVESRKNGRNTPRIFLCLREIRQICLIKFDAVIVRKCAFIDIAWVYLHKMHKHECCFFCNRGFFLFISTILNFPPFLKKGLSFFLNFHENQLTRGHIWRIYAWFGLLIFFLLMHVATTCGL